VADAFSENVKIENRRQNKIVSVREGVALEFAGAELERIVAQSLRQAPPAQAPLMAWPIVCGSAVAERTLALSFINGVLRVRVADMGWQSELQTLTSRYLTAINRYTTEAVHRIDFVVARAEDADFG
jgi:Dna[CI] antecedent, DciA